jgi:uncharacterized protein YjbJ (UPF0337 family)
MAPLIDRIRARFKKAAGDLKGDAGLRREGIREERKADAQDELREAHDQVVEKAQEVERLDRDD